MKFDNQYIRFDWAVRDRVMRQNHAHDTSIAEGREIGYAEGLAEGEANLIKRMLGNGMSLQEIASMTGYASEKIEQLIKA